MESCQCLSFSFSCSFLDRNLSLKLTVVQKRQNFCSSSGLYGISAVWWIFLRFQRVGKQMLPSLQVNLKIFSHVTGQPKFRGFSLQPSQAAACAVQLFSALPEQGDSCFSRQSCSHTWMSKWHFCSHSWKKWRMKWSSDPSFSTRGTLLQFLNYVRIFTLLSL